MQVELSRNELIVMATVIADWLNKYVDDDVEALQKKVSDLLEHDHGNG